MIAGLNDDHNINLIHLFQVGQRRRNKSVGANLISVGLTANFADVYSFVYFAAGFYDNANMNIGNATFDIQPCRLTRDSS
jgi:hypothetical protein